MFPGSEDLLPPPPKKKVQNTEGELLPPPPKKKVDTGTGDGGGIDLPFFGTVGTSKAQSASPEIKTTVTEEFTGNQLDPAFEINKKREANSIITNSQILGKIEIPDEAIPENIIDKKGYRAALQQRLNSKTPAELDLQVIATTTNKPVEAVEAYAQGRDGKGIMLEFDTVKKTKSGELANLIKGANADLGLNDTFEAVFTSPETASLYIDKIQNAYDKKTEQDFESLNTRTIDGKTITYDEESERYIDKRLPAGQKYYNSIKNRNNEVVGMFKATIGEDIIQKVETEVANGNLTYDAGVKRIGDLLFKNELKDITEAKEQRRIKDASGRNELGKLFRDEDEETKNLNSVNSIVESRLNNSIRQKLIYKQAALSDVVQLVTEKANAGTLTEEEKATYQRMVEQLKSDIETTQKEYKSPQELQKKYPVLLKQSLVADINEFNAIQSGNVKGYEAGFFKEGGYEGISLKEHLAAQGYDMNSQVVKDVLSDANKGIGVKDYSFFGEPIKAIKDVFVSSGKSIGDIAGTRDDVTVLSEKKAAELFPTTVGANDELQLTTAASTVQNIANTTGQVIGQGLMQTATAGLGRLAGLSKVAASGAGFWSSGTLTSYDNAYKDAFDLPIDGLGRTTYAGLIALANGASEKIFPESKIFNIPGVKSAYSELATKIGTEGFTDKLANQLLNKAKNAFIDYGQKYATNIGKETLEETATSLFESGARFVFGDPNMNMDKAIEDAKNTAIQTAIGTSLIGGMGVHKDVQQEKNIAPVSVIYNAAVYKDEAMDALDIGLKNNLYDEVEYNNKVSLLNTAEVSLSELGKAEQVIGRELTRPQKELFVANSTAQKLLTEQKKEVDNPAIVAKIDEKLKNLQSQQMQLLDNKVQFDDFGNVVEPVAEVVTEETTIQPTETQTTVTETPIDIVNTLQGNKNVPAFEFNSMVANPEIALREIADQSLGFTRDEDGNRQPLNETAPEPQLEATLRKYGQEVVDKAIAMFPAEITEVKDNLTEISPEEIKRQMQPHTDKMAEIEIEFKNEGYEIDWDYDNEIQVTDKKGEIVEPDELPTKLRKQAADYEKSTQQLADYDHKSYNESLTNSRKRISGEEVSFEEVKGKDVVVDEGVVDGFSNQEKPIIEKLRQADIIEQVNIDKGLHDASIGTGRFNKEGDKFLSENKKLKDNVASILNGEITDNKVINETIEGLKNDQSIHQQYLDRKESGNTGTHAWHNEWVKIYDNWIKELESKKGQSLSTNKPEIKNEEATTSQTIKTKEDEIPEKSSSGVQTGNTKEDGQSNKSDQKEKVKETGSNPKKVAPVSEEKAYTKNALDRADAKKIFAQVREVDEPQDAAQVAHEYIANNGKVSADAIDEVAGTVKRASLNTGRRENLSNEVKARDYYDSNEEGGLDALAHYLWEKNDQRIPENEIKDALMNVIGTYNTRLEAGKAYLEKYSPEYNERQEEEKFYQEHLEEIAEVEKAMEEYFAGEVEAEFEAMQDENYVTNLIEKYESEIKGEDKQSPTETEKSNDKGTGNKRSATKAAKDLADRIRKGKIDADISMVGVPFAKQVWNAAVEVVAKSVELTGNLADAIEKGIAYIKSTDWYKDLSKENRERAEAKFREGDFLTEEETEDIQKNLSDRIQNIDHVYVGKSAYSATDTFAEQGFEQLGRKPQGRVTTIGAMIQARLDFLNQLNEETDGDAVKVLMDYFGFDKHNKKAAKSIPLKGLSNEGSYAMVNTLFAYINKTPLSELNITPAQSAAYSKYLQKLSSELGRKLGQELNTGKIRNILSYTETDNIMGSILTEPQRLTIREAENLMNDIRSGEHNISDEDLADAEEGSLEYETELEKQAEQSRTIAEIIGLKKQQTVSKSQSEKILKRIGKVVKETEEKIKDLINKINCA